MLLFLSLMHHTQVIGRCGGQSADTDDSVSTMCCSLRLQTGFFSCQVKTKTASHALGHSDLNTIKKMHLLERNWRICFVCKYPVH